MKPIKPKPSPGKGKKCQRQETAKGFNPSEDRQAALIEMAARHVIPEMSVAEVAEELRREMGGYDHHLLPGGHVSPSEARTLLALGKATVLLSTLPEDAGVREMVEQTIDMPTEMSDLLDEVAELASVTPSQVVSVLIAGDVIRKRKAVLA